MVKWSSRNESFEDLETKGKTKSGMNRAVKIGLKVVLCKGIHDSRGFWIPPCGFRIPSTGFRIPKRPGFQIFFSVLCFSSHFVFVFESCYIERRCLECITSLFSVLFRFINYVKKCITVP